jgi:LmbE family N-acetylglucosaminyl deacetylase
MAEKVRVLVVGAHPDDCELKAGGAAALWADGGHVVRFVSATDGGAGHHKIGGVELVRRRREEARRAAEVLGIESLVMDVKDGELEPTLENRREFIRLIREFRPDLVLTHRPNDYHPDHRATSVLVQDAVYLVTVPNVLPSLEVMREMPVVMYLSDSFQKPNPFIADAAVGIDRVLERKVDAVRCHASQFCEWLPWNMRVEEQVPTDDAGRRQWMRDWRVAADRECAKKWRARLTELYGKDRGESFEYAEAFEACEYGAKLTGEKLEMLFPFLNS